MACTSRWCCQKSRMGTALNRTNISQRKCTQRCTLCKPKPKIRRIISPLAEGNGGERGIRTLETVPRLHTFQACAFDHSAISPRGSPIIRLCGLCQGAWCKKAAKLSFEGIICRVRGVQALAVKQILKIRLRIPRSAMLLLTKPFEEIEVR